MLSILLASSHSRRKAGLSKEFLLSVEGSAENVAGLLCKQALPTIGIFNLVFTRLLWVGIKYSLDSVVLNTPRSRSPETLEPSASAGAAFRARTAVRI